LLYFVIRNEVCLEIYRAEVAVVALDQERPRTD